MKRREMLGAVGAATLASISGDGMAAVARPGSSRNKREFEPDKFEKKDMKLGNDHFLSATNPLATADQRDLEALALRIIQAPEIKKAREISTWRLKILTGRDATAEAWSSFDSVMEEWIYHNALMAVNFDPNYPKVLRRWFAPPHEWFGMKVPGSRGFGGISPDTTYTLIPIDNNARFEISGRRFEPSPVDVQFSLSANALTTITVANLEWRTMQFNPDGTFVITLDPEPANGRHNHIQTGPDARLLFIRDVRADWREVPNAYLVRRLDPPLMPPMTFQQMVERAMRYIIEDVAGCYPFMTMTNTTEINNIPPPFATGTLGGLVTQMMCLARLKIADDEAYVLTVNPGGAKHHVIPVVNFWLCGLNFWDHTSSMNSRQSVPNADGTTTYVVSLKDPGVHNWVDTVGLHEPRLQMRWHALPDKPPAGGGPSVKGELVKLADLKKVLPAEMKWVTAAERKQQLAERLETFSLRNVV